MAIISSPQNRRDPTGTLKHSVNKYPYLGVNSIYRMPNKQKQSKTLHVTLWIAQVILALSLIWAGAVKLFQPAAQLAEMWPWTAEQESLVKVTAMLDLIAGIGLVFPALLHIKPRLTIYAAYGIIVLMFVASIFHIARGEASQIGVNIFFMVMATFIVWGRQNKQPRQSPE